MNWMRYFIAVAVFCLFSVYSNQTAWAERKKFLIPPFQNFSPHKVRTDYEVTLNESNDRETITTIKKSFKIDMYSEAGRSLFEHKMFEKFEGMKGRTIERQRIDQMLSESGLTNQNGYVNKESALEMGVLAGANTLIMGTILNIQNKEEIVTAYGLKEHIKKTICSIRIRIIDIESGHVLFSKMAEGEAPGFTSSNYGGRANSDSGYTALKKSIDSLFDMDFRERMQEYINK